MKWILRVLMILHIGFVLYGAFCILFKEEYIYSSKYVFVGLTGLFFFLNAFLLIPLSSFPNKVLMALSLALYLITVMGFWQPNILKNYWEWLISAAIVVVLNSLYVRLIKDKKKWESWLFPILSILIVLPFVAVKPSDGAMLVSTLLLFVLTIFLFFKTVKT
jgi:hypothetical protein